MENVLLITQLVWGQPSSHPIIAVVGVGYTYFHTRARSCERSPHREGMTFMPAHDRSVQWLCVWQASRWCILFTFTTDGNIYTDIYYNYVY